MEKELAKFTVRTLSADNGNWQGEILSEGKCFRFQSELQLLRWVRSNYPELVPKAAWTPDNDHPL